VKSRRRNIRESLDVFHEGVSVPRIKRLIGALVSGNIVT
jgi:hypothetical protein